MYNWSVDCSWKMLTIILVILLSHFSGLLAKKIVLLVYIFDVYFFHSYRFHAKQECLVFFSFILMVFFEISCFLSILDARIIKELPGDR